MTKPVWRFVPLLAALATVGCDRVTKASALTLLSGTAPRSFWHGTLRLELVTNSGAFLSLGADWAPLVRLALLGIGSGVLLVALAIVAIRGRWDRTAQIGAAFIVAGGASNLLDRLATGEVIDFMNVGIGSVRTGIFNVADVAILMGAVLIAQHGVRRTRLAASG